MDLKVLKGGKLETKPELPAPTAEDFAKAIYADLKELSKNTDMPDAVTSAFTGTIIKYLDETKLIGYIKDIEAAAKIAAVTSTCFYSGFTIGRDAMRQSIKKEEK